MIFSPLFDHLVNLVGEKTVYECDGDLTFLQHTPFGKDGYILYVKSDFL